MKWPRGWGVQSRVAAACSNQSRSCSASPAGTRGSPPGSSCGPASSPSASRLVLFLVLVELHVELDGRLVDARARQLSGLQARLEGRLVVGLPQQVVVVDRLLVLDEALHGLLVLRRGDVGVELGVVLGLAGAGGLVVRGGASGGPRASFCRRSTSPASVPLRRQARGARGWRRRGGPIAANLPAAASSALLSVRFFPIRLAR